MGSVLENEKEITVLLEKREGARVTASPTAHAAGTRELQRAGCVGLRKEPASLQQLGSKILPPWSKATGPC